MGAPDHRTSSSLNALLTAIALLWLGLIGYAFLRDLGRQHGESETSAEHLAARALNEVKDTNHGWFPAQRDPMFSWDDGEQGWVLEADDPTALTPAPVYEAPANGADSSPKAKRQLRVMDAPETERGQALAVPVHFPDPATVFRDSVVSHDDKYKMQGVRFIAYDVLVPKDCRGFVGCLFFLKDKDGLWYEARSRAALVPGRWNTVAVDIRGGSPNVTPLGHLGQWDENQATRVRTIGITLYGDREFEGTILVDNFRAWQRPQRFTQMLSTLTGAANPPVGPERIEHLRKLANSAAAFKEPPLELFNFRTDPQASGSPPEVARFETLTLRFELNRQADNPFDPDKADIVCAVETPSGQKLEHTGFWYQDYDRADRFVGDELTPLGRPEWRVRITPREEGAYKYSLRIRLRQSLAAEWDTLETPPRQFVCKPSANKGFVRVSKTDPRFFEFETGEFFYPVGHNLHSPVDIRCWKEVFRQQPPAGRGLPLYADLMPKMQQHGENTAEIWMCAWWVGIEWTTRWRDYYGPARYSLQHAWLLDRLLTLARQNGLQIHLVIDNHGKFSSWCDWEWDLNPYNKNCDANGVVTYASEFFSDETARRWHRNKLRYIAARWGSDPTIMGWELVSEYDLVGGRHRGDAGARQNFHRGPVLQAWAREMIEHLRRCDVYRHPVTNHYATDYTWIDLQLARSELFDYVVTDAYRADRPYTGIAMRSQNWVTSSLLNAGVTKPFWITEFGGDWNATVPAALDADAHCGLWATWMTEGAGTPLFWWYDFVDRGNLYPYYRAFANYIKGEDRRRVYGVMDRLTIVNGTPPARLDGQTYRWTKGAYAWVFNRSAMEMMPSAAERVRFENVETLIRDLEPGPYRVEFWDCYDGKLVQSDTATAVEGQPLLIKFPPFVSNMAAKIKPGRPEGEKGRAGEGETRP